MVNLLDLQREFMEKGEPGFGPDEVVRQAKTIIDIVPFKNNPYKSGVIGEYKRKRVFLNSGYQGLPVQDGDVYVCILEFNDAGNVYYATPLRKIDMGVLMEIDNDIRDDITAKLWQKYDRQFIPIFEEKYLQSIQEKISSELKSKFDIEIERKNTEIDELRSMMRELRNELATRPSQTETILDSEEIILSSDDSESLSEPPPKIHETPSIQNQPNNGRIRDPMEPISTTHSYKVMIKGNRLFCESLKDGRYYVHLSPDRRTLLIRPNENGNILAFNRGISVNRLIELIGTTDTLAENHVEAEYDEKYSGMIVHI